MSTDFHTHDGIEYGSGCPICLDNIQAWRKEDFFNWLDEQENKPSLLAEIIAHLKDNNNE